MVSRLRPTGRAIHAPPDHWVVELANRTRVFMMCARKQFAESSAADLHGGVEVVCARALSAEAHPDPRVAHNKPLFGYHIHVPRRARCPGTVVTELPGRTTQASDSSRVSLEAARRALVARISGIKLAGVARQAGTTVLAVVVPTLAGPSLDHITDFSRSLHWRGRGCRGRHHRRARARAKEHSRDCGAPPARSSGGRCSCCSVLLFGSLFFGGCCLRVGVVVKLVVGPFLFLFRGCCLRIGVVVKLVGCAPDWHDVNKMRVLALFVRFHVGPRGRRRSQHRWQ